MFLVLLVFAADITTVAGTGEAGYAGDGGPALNALLDQPFHCALDGKGGLLIAESFNHCVRRLDLKTGVLTTVAGTGKKGDTGDGGPATAARFNEVYAVAVSPDGALYLTDRLNRRIRKVDAEGVVTTVAGHDRKTKLAEPNDCHLDGKGGLLIADVGAWQVLRLDLKTGEMTPFAGVPRKPGKYTLKNKGDGGPATAAVVHGARAVCVDGKGNTYICEREGNSVRKVDAAGVITTLAGDTTKGKADGVGTKAKFNGPKAIRCDPAGDVFVVDTENHSVRRIDVKTGAVTTVAGGRKGPDGDGGDAVKAGMGRPHGLAIDAEGVLYVADSDNHRVRRVR
ncbi:MAG: SMP-30/gluconolactonase/LRE family protein [Gemmataceae bacterium]